MKTHYFLLLFIFILDLSGQVPELVSDFTPGEESTFDKWNYRSYQGNDFIVVPINSIEFGQELAIIKDGEISLLKDINPGIESSKPKDFFTYNGEIYFKAQDATNGYAIWKTDGTEAGTKMALDPGTDSGSPGAFIEAQNGWLYYSYSGKLYRTDGTDYQEVYDAPIGYAHSSKTYSKYKNGIAFISKNDDDSFSLIHIDENVPVELARTEETGFFTDGFGVSPVKNGIIFSIYDSDIDATYLYSETDNSLQQLTIGGHNLPSRRYVRINDDYTMCWLQSQGYYAVNGVEGEEVLLHESSNFAASQGESVIHGLYNNQLTFIPLNSGWNSEEFLLTTDGTSEVTNLLSLENSQLSNMTVIGKHAFFADGISNGFNPNIYYVDLESGHTETVYSFSDRSLQIESILPLGVIKDYLYFINKLDLELGAELFRIKLENDISSASEVTPVHQVYTLSHKGNLLEIKTEETHNISVSAYNMVGQLLKNKQVLSNQPFDLSLPSGQFLIQFSLNGVSHLESVFMFRD